MILRNSDTDLKWLVNVRDQITGGAIDVSQDVITVSFHADDGPWWPCTHFDGGYVGVTVGPSGVTILDPGLSRVRLRIAEGTKTPDIDLGNLWTQP